jgi:hypothetical protein
MTDLTPDPTGPDAIDDLDGPDQGLVRRALDHEATAAELEALHADPRLSEVLARQRGALDQLTEPVAPLSGSTVDAMVARALTQGGLGDAAVTSGDGPPSPTTSLAEHRVQREPVRWGNWAAAAAAVVLLLGIGTVVVRAAGSSSTDTASSGSAELSSESSADDAAADQAAAGAARAQSGAESAGGAADRSPPSPTTVVPTSDQLASFGPQDVGDTVTIDALVDRVLDPQAFDGSNTALVPSAGDQGAVGAAEELAACLASRSIGGTVERWVRGLVEGQAIDVVVLSHPVLGPQVVAVGPGCSIERARPV